jgi:hypothetical protein
MDGAGNNITVKKINDKHVAEFGSGVYSFEVL